MDLSAYNDPLLQFRYFFFNGLISDLVDDDLDVVLLVNDTEEISLNNFMDDTGGWSDVVEIKLSDLTNDLSNVRVVFYAEEGGELNVYNAAIDVFRVVEGSPTSTISPKVEQHVWVSPNPFNNSTIVSFSSEFEWIELIDQVGRSISKEKVTSNKMEVGENMQAGVYFGILTNSKGDKSVFKIVKL